jgi:pimeloyl-ACP methyl ester carboxylesterase
VHGTVVQHDARSSLRACAPLLAAFAASRHGLAVELPGHGETDLPANCDAGNLESLAGLLLGALDALGIESAALIGIGAGAAVQTAVARARPELAASLTLIAPIDVTREPQLQSRLRDSYRPPHPDPSGCHLLQAWHEVRDHLLFFPWYERRRAFAVAASPRLEPAFLQSRTVDLLLAGAAGVDVRKAELDYPLRARLGGLALTPRVAAPLWEPRYAHSQRLAQPPEGFFTLSRHGRRWARDIDRLEQSLESP